MAGSRRSAWNRSPCWAYPTQPRKPAAAYLPRWGCRAFIQLARGKGRVALVIDDISRPTPVRQMLPVVLAELHAAGVGPERISLVHPWECTAR